jgi:SH3-like domain-containing protein
MQAHIKSLILIILVGFITVGFARGAGAPPGKESAVKAGDTKKTDAPSFPYATEITDDDVPIRSGPGTNYYICGKLKQGEKVKVVGSQFSWSRIVPPSGSFSWISMRNVSIDTDNSTIGIVTADGMRVYAGSEHMEPIHSEHLQLKLKRGDEVKFVGKPKGDYYKIAPPEGAYLWVSTKYTKPIAVPPPKVSPTIVTPTTTDTKPIPKPKPKIKPIVPKTVSGEGENLKLYYTLQEQIKAEREKPADQQNYENIKKALAAIAGNKEAGKAARYADLAIKQIKGFELALVIAKEVQLQNEELQKTQEQIDRAHATRLAQVESLGRFAVIGKFQTSNIFGSGAEQKHYRITDDNDKLVCYALSTGPASKKDLSKLAGSKVGLIGTIEPYPQTAGALVRFTNIVELN